jgi:hypothetical protein
MTIIWSDPIIIAGKIEYPQLWDAPAIGLRIQGSALPIWRKVGYLRIEPFIDGEFFNYQVKSIDYGKNLIQIPYRHYRLSFEPLESLIQIYSNLSIEIAPIGDELMSINYQNVERTTGPVVDTPFTPSTTSGQALGVDLLRHDGTIYNRTNRIIYIAWGTTAATAANLPVPAGANAKIPLDYTGAVQILAAAGALTGNVLSQTTSYV